MKKKLILLFALTLIFCVCFTLAACKVNPHVAKFNANGGTVTLDGKPVEADGVKCLVVNEPEATKKGYQLIGWYLDENFTKEVPSWPYTLTEDTTFYAKWMVEPAPKYTVIFEAAGGSAVASQRTDVVATSPVTTRAGFAFVGWFDNYACTGNPINFPYTPTHDITLYAKWLDTSITTYTVIFEAAGGSAVTTQRTDVVATSPVTTRANYTFVGWFDNYACEGSPVVFPYAPTRDITLYAKWQPITAPTYTLTLNPMGGDQIDPIKNVSVVYQNTLPTPTKTGSTFLYWCTDEGLTTQVTFPYTLEKDTIFYAKWETPKPVEYTITLVDAGSGVTATLDGAAATITESDGKYTVKGESGAKLALTNPTKEGATFQGWYTTSNFSGSPVTFPFTLDGNRYFYAKWAITGTPTAESIAELTQYFNKTAPPNYATGYGLLVQNSVADVNDNFYYTYYVGDNIGSVEYSKDTGTWQPAYRDWAFARDDEASPYWMTYCQNDEGAYQYNGAFYEAEPLANLEEGFLMVYLKNLSQLNPAQFIKVGEDASARWYATSEYVDEAGHLLLGNASGAPEKYDIVYTELVLSFDANGNVVGINAKSQVVDTFQSGQATAATIYYYNHTITVDSTSDGLEEIVVAFPAENAFYTDDNRPSGYYPPLNSEDANRQVATGDKDYTKDELRQALGNLSSFTSYYTFAGNTFNGYIYNPVTIVTNGNVGKIVTNAYSYEIGDQTVTQQAARDQFFVYNEDLGAFFLISPNTNNGYDIYCDQYSYKNNYYYNQYLLGVSGSGSAISFNCKYPAVSVKYMDADKFTYKTNGKYFEYTDVRTLTAAGKALFGDMDLVYPEMGETETYVYLRVYMNAGKIAKVVAASQLALFDGGTEFFVKELVVTDYSTPTVTLPTGVTDDCIVPGEEKVGGSIDALKAALASTNASSYAYTDKFVYDDYDELGGVFQDGASDTYVYSNGIARILASGGKYYYLYFKDGKLYAQLTGNSVAEPITLAWTGDDVEKANEWITWAYPISGLISADWFYEGKDGKFYGKTEYMTELSAALARYSGSESFLEGDAGLRFSDAYRWTVQLDFVSVEVSAGKLSNFYYSGVILVKGSAGSHTKPFSGYATFSYDAPTLTLPVSDTVDQTRPALQHYLDASNNLTFTDLGIVNFDEKPNATGYKLYVYESNTAANPIAVVDDLTNGFDLKTVTELNVQATPTTYYVSFQALGNGTAYLDSPLSERMVVVLSTLPKLEKPAVSIDGSTVTVGAVANSTSFHYDVYKGSVTESNRVAQDNVTSGNTLDLATLGITWEEKQTYTIVVYRRPTDPNAYRQSDNVTVLYTPPKAEGTYIDDLFAPFDFTQSFSLSLTNQGVSKNHIYTTAPSVDAATLMGSSDKALDAAATYKMVLNLWYDAPSQKGKLVFYTYNASGSGYNKDDVDLHPVHVVFRFTKSDNKLVGSFTKTEMGATVTDEKNYAMDLLFRSLGSIDQSKFVETSGALSDYRGLVYNYAADVEHDSALQQALADFSPLEELFGTTFTYMGLQATVGYNTSGDLCTGNGVTLLATAADGSVMVLKLAVSGVGGNHLPNINS